jgi:hypothetical protein
MVDFCAHGNKLSGSTKRQETCYVAKDYQVLKKDITPCQFVRGIYWCHAVKGILLPTADTKEYLYMEINS